MFLLGPLSPGTCHRRWGRLCQVSQTGKRSSLCGQTADFTPIRKIEADTRQADPVPEEEDEESYGTNGPPAQAASLITDSRSLQMGMFKRT
jgi:hypothetical protein